MKLAFEPLQGSIDHERGIVAFELDVTPSQAENLASPHAERERELIEGAEALIACRLDEAAGLLGRERLDLLAFEPGRIDECGDVATYDAALDGEVEGDAQDSANMADCLRCCAIGSLSASRVSTCWSVSCWRRT
jgi:hypothetical protein